ncbi:MAG TPA: toll/interleukin-1 receptor domain-containing protein [Anaerolineales bacterium]|nr:toll/interleukin-1 receptor domain-containing protein [Anaerolineales bacterium]
MAKIFLSYSRKDSAVARKLIEAFKEMGHDPWVDWEDIPPAVGWLEQIFRGIEGSDTFFFLVSPDSVTSVVCGVEVSKAAENNKRIIPIVVRDVNTREVKVHPTIGELNWIRFREGDSFEEALAFIKVAIELDIEWLEEHGRLQLRALEWHRENDSSLLLRGRDYRLLCPDL